MEDTELVDGAAPLDGVALDVADEDDYDSREEEDDTTAMIMLNGDTNVEKIFQQEVV